MTTDVPAEHETRAARRALHAGARPGADPAAPAVRPRPVVIAAVVVVGLVISAAGASGERVLEVIAIVAAGLLVALGWPRLVGSSTPVGTSVVLAVTALGVGAALLVQDSEPYLEHVPAALALGIIAMCLHPLVQASARVHLATTLGGTALGLLLIGGAGLLASTDSIGQQGPVVIAGIAVSVAALADLVLERPGASRWMIPSGMLAGAVVGVLAHLLLDGSLAAWPALLGVMAAGAAVALRRVASQQGAVDSVPGAVAAGAASVLVVAPIVHLVARLPLI